MPFRWRFRITQRLEITGFAAYHTGNKIYLSLLNLIKGQYDAAWGKMPCPEIGRLRTQTAELGCGPMPRVSCDPSGWDQRKAPLYCRTDTPSEYRGVKPLPQFPRLSILYPPQASKRGGCWHIVFYKMVHRVCLYPIRIGKFVANHQRGSLAHTGYKQIRQSHWFSSSATGRTADGSLHGARGVTYAKRVRKVFATP